MVEILRLAFLYLVPHEDVLRHEIQLALARQVVPAGHREDVADAAFDRGAREIQLCRLQHDERSGDEDVGTLLTQVLAEQRGAAGRLFEHVDDSDEQPPRAGATTNPFAESDRQLRCARPRARKQFGRLFVFGPEKTQVETRLPQPRRELPPRIEGHIREVQTGGSGGTRQPARRRTGARGASPPV